MVFSSVLGFMAVSYTHLRVLLRFRGGSQVNAALLADFLVVALDVVNQLAGSLVDGLQTCLLYTS